MPLKHNLIFLVALNSWFVFLTHYSQAQDSSTDNLHDELFLQGEEANRLFAYADSLLSNDFKVEAVTYFDQALNLYQNIYQDRPERLVRILEVISESFASRNLGSLGIIYAHKGIDILNNQREVNTSYIGKLHLLIGNIQRSQGFVSVALESFQNSYQYFSINPTPQYFQDFLVLQIMLGHSYFDLKDYQKAINFYDLVKGHIVELDGGELSKEVAILHRNIANVYISMDSAEVAMPYYRKYVEINENIYTQNSQETAKAYQELADAYFYTHFYDSAWQTAHTVEGIYKYLLGDYQEEELAFYEAQGKNYFAIQAYNNSAYWYEKYFDFAAKHGLLTYFDLTEQSLGIAQELETRQYLNFALPFYQKGLFYAEATKEENLSVDYGQLAYKIAEIHNQMTNYDHALEYYQKAVHYFDFTDSELDADCSFKIGYIYTENSQYNLAIEHFKEALFKLSPERKFLRSEIYHDIALCYYHKKDFENALTYAKQLVNFYEENYAEHINLKDSYILLGNVHRAKQNTEEALNYYSKFLQENIDVLDPETTTQLYQNWHSLYQHSTVELMYEKIKDICLSIINPSKPIQKAVSLEKRKLDD